MKSLLRSTVLFAVATGLAACPVPAGAATREPPVEGRPYVQLDHPQPAWGSPGPQAEGQSAKAEVVEFFWYDCVHSHQLEKPLHDWAARHHDDVTLRRVPGIWRGTSDTRAQLGHAHLYYTLERLGQVERLQGAVFHSVRDNKEDVTTEDTATAWAVRQGVDGQAFRAAYRSAEVEQQTAWAARLVTRYEITELPSVVVQGRYSTSPSRAGGVDAMPAALDRMVQQH